MEKTLENKISNISILKVLEGVTLHLAMQKPNGANNHPRDTLRQKILFDIGFVGDSYNKEVTFGQLSKAHEECYIEIVQALYEAVVNFNYSVPDYF